MALTLFCFLILQSEPCGKKFFRMKQKLLFLLIALAIMLPARVFAYDKKHFEYAYEGSTLRYEVIDEDAKTCLVFQTCADLPEDVVIPNVAYDGSTGYTVTEIGQEAFAESSQLVSVVIPNSITKIGWRTFDHCIGLTSVVIPNSVTTIDYAAFIHCINLLSVNMPNSVTIIGELAFYGCSCLTSIEIPNSVTEIGNFAFNECSNMTSVVCKSETPISNIYNNTIYSIENVFSKDTYEKATLYVPKGCVDAYKNAEVWDNFVNITDKDFNGVDIIEADDKDIDYGMPYEIFNMEGVKVGDSKEGLENGVYIVRQGKAVRKIIVN